MDGQLSRKKVIGSPIYEESLERTFVEGIERFGMFQARNRITEERIEVLDIFHSASSMRKIKKTKNIHIE